MKEKRNILYKAITTALFGSLSAAATPALFAQQDQALEEVVVIGSRGAPRTALESPVPVDVFSGEDFVNAGSPDMNDLLRDLVPSYSVTEQQISDTNSLVRPSTLRNLPADNTLVLVNGKRRHRSAGLQFGNTGINFPDVQYIPPIALQQVEVLRDAAAAQYGSDAIAGIINFRMAEEREGFSLDAKYGFFPGDVGPGPDAVFPDGTPVATTPAGVAPKGDGQTREYQARLGLPLGAEGFLTLSGVYLDQARTDRAIQRRDAQNVIEAGNGQVRAKVMDRGQPDEERWTLFANWGVPLSPRSELYGFGNVGRRDTEIGFFFRNPENTGGIFTRNNEQGEKIQAFIDLSGAADPLNNCPQIPVGVDPATGITSSVLALQAAQADPNCFSFLEQFPGGYTPVFGSRNTDVSWAMGVRGDFDTPGGFAALGETQYDISWYFGFNEMTFKLDNTTAPSFGPQSQNSFEPGIYTVFENTLTADFVTPVDIGLSSPLNVAYGLEWRRETFEIRNEDVQAWQIGPFADQGFNIGSNGFPGFSPIQTGTFDRSNWASYVDLQLSPIEGLDIGAAGRVEGFYDTVNRSFADYKVTARYELPFANNIFAIRGSQGTGIRVASPGQQNVTFISTGITDGVPVNEGQVPPTNPIAQLFGGKQLTPEDATSYSVGLTAAFPFGLDLSVDFFRIDIDDRITNSGDIEIDEATAAAIEATGISGARDIIEFSFFTNAVDSRTQGIEVVADYPIDLGRFGNTNISLGYTFKDEEIQRVDFQPSNEFNPDGEPILTDTPILTREQQLELEERQPDHRANINLRHQWNDWRLAVATRYYGTIIDADSDGPEFDTKVGAEWIVDANLGYTLFNRFEITFGVENLFDNHADPLSTSQGSGSVSNSTFWNSHVFGTEGRFVYSRLRFDL